MNNQQVIVTQTKVSPVNQVGWNVLPETGFLRIWQIIGSKKKNTPALIPIGRTTFLNGVKSGKYPQSIKLGERSVAWRVEDIKEFITAIGGAK